MSIDRGPDTTERLIAQKYIKTTTQGLTFTREGVEWLVTALQELYHAISEIHQELDSRGGNSVAPDDITRSDSQGDSV